jgi:hypothetical protein
MTRVGVLAAAAVAAALVAAPAARAGDVSATLVKQTLTLKGDDAGADLTLSPPVVLSRGGGGGTQVLVTPNGGTTLNGAATALTFDGVENLKITLGDGSNVLLFDQLLLDGNLALKGGSGADSVTFMGSGFTDSAKLSTGEGVGSVTLAAGSSFDDTLSLKAGSGADTLVFEGGVGDSVKINLGAGANSFTGGGAVVRTSPTRPAPARTW